MKKILRKHILIIVLSAAGALGGLLYWKFVGCKTGTCPIKSVWYLSTLWGLIMGGLIGSLVEDVVIKFKIKNASGQGESTGND
jgi:hypothetical protein